MIKKLQVIAIIFTLLLSFGGFFLVFGPDRFVGLIFMLMASILMSGLLISEAIVQQKN